MGEDLVGAWGDQGRQPETRSPVPIDFQHWQERLGALARRLHGARRRVLAEHAPRGDRAYSWYPVSLVERIKSDSSLDFGMCPADERFTPFAETWRLDLRVAARGHPEARVSRCLTLVWKQ